VSDGLDDGWVVERLERWRTRRDGDALGELLKWQRDRAYAIARRVLGHATDAEDAVQQSFVKLLSRTQGFEGVNEFKLAVYRAVVQCALDMARANRVRNRLEKAMSQVERGPAHLPEPAFEQAEALRLVFRELEQMPEEQRALVVLCYQEGLSVSDAAEVLAIPRETLRDRLATSLADLRRNVAKRGVAVSLLLLVGALQNGRAEAAPASLCEALDVTLPGAPCAAIPAAPAVIVPPAELLAGTTTASSVLPAKFLLSSAAALALAFGGWVAWTSTGTGAATQRVATATDGRQPKMAASPKSNETVPGARPEIVRNPVTGAKQQPPQDPPVVIAVPPVAQDAAAGRSVADKRAKKPAKAKLTLDRVPADVRAIATQAVPGITLTKVKQETDGGVPVYEFKGKAGDKEYEIQVTKDGKLLAAKEDDHQDDEEENDGDERETAPRTEVPRVEAPKADF
jgi:RNA polymerase sigma-70 factor, ECF subfamily